MRDSNTRRHRHRHLGTNMFSPCFLWNMSAHVQVPIVDPLGDYGEQLVNQQRSAFSTKVLKGCKVEDTYCGTALCMCRTPGSWVGSFLTLKISAEQKRNPLRIFMPVLPGSGDISIRRFWEVCILPPPHATTGSRTVRIFGPE